MKIEVKLNMNLEETYAVVYEKIILKLEIEILLIIMYMGKSNLFYLRYGEAYLWRPKIKGD